MSRETVKATVEETKLLLEGVSAKYAGVRENKGEIVSMYREGIQAIKRYPLHPSLAKDQQKGQHLIDIYYAESSMNNFMANCVTNLDKFGSKLDSV